MGRLSSLGAQVDLERHLVLLLLWFHYASFINIRLTPSLRGRAWVGPVLALVGFAWLLVAYVGTSFFFGQSRHSF